MTTRTITITDKRETVNDLFEQIKDTGLYHGAFVKNAEIETPRNDDFLTINIEIYEL